MAAASECCPHYEGQVECQHNGKGRFQSAWLELSEGSLVFRESEGASGALHTMSALGATV
jgi:hypothetical protein|eukprot:COSAG01_NODE_1539_length_9983_cov_211.998381_3_plen_60_part_00